MNPFTPKVMAVVRREFMQRVRSKWFLVSTVGLPLLIVGLGGLAGFLVVQAQETEDDEERILGVAAADATLADLVVEELLEDSLSASRARDLEGLTSDEVGEALSGSTYGYALYLPDWYGDPDPDEDEERPSILALGNIPSATENRIERAVQRALVRNRLQGMGLEQVDATELLQRSPIDVVTVSDTGEARSQDVYRAVSFGIAFMFYMILLIYGQMIVRSILEEKQSDIVEVMVSSLRPWELMLGKIVGVGAVGIAQIGVWAGIGTIATIYSLTGGANTLAEMGIDPSSISIPWGTIAVVLTFLILGYLLYAGMFAGAGATISNEHDAQQAVMPITMLIILPFIAVQGVLENPDAGWAVIISLIPFFSPLVMTSRMIVSAVPLWQSVLSIVLLAFFVFGAAWVAGRIYRVGILMKGQRANLPEVMRWIRHG